MFSVPPATMIEASPVSIQRAAVLIASGPLPQMRFTVYAGHLDRDAALHRGVAGDVAILHHLPYAAEDHLLDLLRLYTGATHRLLDHNCPQIGGRKVLKRAAQTANGGTATANEYNLFHALPPLSGWRVVLGGKRSRLYQNVRLRQASASNRLCGCTLG